MFNVVSRAKFTFPYFVGRLCVNCRLNIFLNQRRTRRTFLWIRPYKVVGNTTTFKSIFCKYRPQNSCITYNILQTVKQIVRTNEVPVYIFYLTKSKDRNKFITKLKITGKRTYNIRYIVAYFPRFSPYEMKI